MPSRSLAQRALVVAVLVGLAAPACSKSKDSAEAEAEPAGPGRAPQSAAELDAPIATIDDQTISVREFQDRINRQSPYVRARYNSVEQKKEFLDSLVRYEVLAREAYRRGLDKDPDAVRAMKTVMIQKLMKAEFEAAVKPEDIPEAELRAYYDGHPEEWNKPEEVRVSAIVLDSKKKADAIAKDVLGEPGTTNKGFRDLVARFSSHEESKLRGGDLRYFARGAAEVPAAVVEAALAQAKTGDVSGPIDAGNGTYYFIKQTGRRRPIAKTFDQVKRQIQNTLWKDRRAEAQKAFVTGLRAKSKIEIFEDNLKKVRIATGGEEVHSHAPADPAVVPGLEGLEPTPPTAPAAGGSP